MRKSSDSSDINCGRPLSTARGIGKKEEDEEEKREKEEEDEEENEKRYLGHYFTQE